MCLTVLGVFRYSYLSLRAGISECAIEMIFLFTATIDQRSVHWVRSTQYIQTGRVDSNDVEQSDPSSHDTLPVHTNPRMFHGALVPLSLPC